MSNSGAIIIAVLVMGIINVEKVSGGVGFGPCNQWYDYITVNSYHKIFVWLVQCDNNNVYNYDSVVHKKPLLIHVGGPEMSASGFGFFYETGPINIRNQTRLDGVTELVNVLFIDVPVGVGFSYTNKTTENEAFSKTSSEVAHDLAYVIIQVLNRLSYLRSMPIILYAESYATKYTLESAYLIDQMNTKHKLKLNLRGVLLGSPWINPALMVLHWAQFAFANGLINILERNEVYNYVNKEVVPKITTSKDILQAGLKFKFIRSKLKRMTHGINDCNIMVPLCGLANFTAEAATADQPENKTLLIDCGLWSKLLQPFMKNIVKGRLGRVVPDYVQWNRDEKTVIKHLANDFMSASSEIFVGLLLNSTQLFVAFINGQIDMVTNTVGVTNWLDSIQWPGKSKFNSAHQIGFSSSNRLCDGLIGYYKEYKKLYHFKLLYTGHYIAKENYKGLRRILETLLNI